MERLEKLQWTSAPTLASCSMAVIRSRRRAMFTAQGSRYQKSAGNGSRCCCSGEWLPMFFLDLGIPLCYWIAAHLSIECTCWFLSLAKVMDEMWYLSWFIASSTKFSNSGTSLKIWILPQAMDNVREYTEYLMKIREITSLYIFGCQNLETQVLLESGLCGWTSSHSSLKEL